MLENKVCGPESELSIYTGALKVLCKMPLGYFKRREFVYSTALYDYFGKESRPTRN